MQMAIGHRRYRVIEADDGILKIEVYGDFVVLLTADDQACGKVAPGKLYL